MRRVWAFVKKWLWLPLLTFIAALFFRDSNKKWEKEKLKEAKGREKRIDELQKEREKIKVESVGDFEKVVEKHNEEIKQAKENVVPVTDPHDIADFIKGYPSKRD
ncbi:MAG: hypothetical protein QM401_04215 [Bacillota bacterium]|nr:hypothetical protein [Bacillota bacterium]